MIVLANRDEFLARPAAPPALLRSAPNAFGGQDTLQGGTWCGFNEHRLFVGLTNIAGGVLDPSRRSRGLLVLDLLGLETIDDVLRHLRSLPANHYNGFNVLASDGARALQASYQGTTTTQWLEPGVHAVVNWPAGTEGADKGGIAEARVRSVLEENRGVEQLIAGLTKTASLHERGGDPRYSLCCHAGLYGTRCSTIVLSGPEETRYYHCEGPPCEGAFEDYSPEVHKLLTSG